MQGSKDVTLAAFPAGGIRRKFAAILDSATPVQRYPHARTLEPSTVKRPSHHMTHPLGLLWRIRRCPLQIPMTCPVEWGSGRGMRFWTARLLLRDGDAGRWLSWKMMRMI